MQKRPVRFADGQVINGAIRIPEYGKIAVKTVGLLQPKAGRGGRPGQE
jgi:hypothetical protein